MFTSSDQVIAEGITRNANGFSISLTGQAQDAVENGVALTFSCEFAIVNRLLFFTWAKNPQRHWFVVTRHALSNRYIVRRNNVQTRYSFRSLHASMNFIAAEARQLHNVYYNRDQQFEMRLSLNKLELLGPIRLSAFLGSDWDLDTGWIKWALES